MVTSAIPSRGRSTIKADIVIGILPQQPVKAELGFGCYDISH
jgi:hypothetical protein